MDKADVTDPHYVGTLGVLDAGPECALSPLQPTRSIPRLTTLQLYSRVAGRCPFRGCGKDLLEHSVTKRAGNFAEQAHIFAFSIDGPRGDDLDRPADAHAAENLMLLCAECHKHIDDQPALFPVKLLQTFKREHEDRVRLAHALALERRTVVVKMTAPIRGAHVSVAHDEIIDAVSPSYPASSDHLHIDLSDLDGLTEGASFIDVAARKIDQEIARLFASGALTETPHLSVFAIAPIPLLIHLGARLENKVPAAFFQKHRDTQNWTWKDDGASFAYVVRTMQEQPRGAPVAVVLSLSGTVGLADLPEETRKNAAIYELTLDGVVPQPTFLNRAGDLARFAPAYHELLGRIAAEHGYLDCIDVFPAVPAPIAVALGRERLMKRHPALRVFDTDKANGGFTFMIEVK